MGSRADMSLTTCERDIGKTCATARCLLAVGGASCIAASCGGKERTWSACGMSSSSDTSATAQVSGKQQAYNSFDFDTWYVFNSPSPP